MNLGHAFHQNKRPHGGIHSLADSQKPVVSENDRTVAAKGVRDATSARGAQNLNLLVTKIMIGKVGAKVSRSLL